MLVQEKLKGIPGRVSRGAQAAILLFVCTLGFGQLTYGADSPRRVARRGPMEPLNGEETKLKPIVVIPGILGSVLEDESGEIWGSLRDVVRIEERLSLRKGSERKARAARVLDTFRLLGPFHTGGYADAMVFFHALGFEDGKTLFPFAYDWRRSNFDTAAALAEFVNAHVELHDKFDIVAHSMGGLVAWIYITEHGGAQHVRRLITVGTPFRGSPEAAFALTSGALPIYRSRVRNAALTFPSVYELLPTYPDCCFSPTGKGAFAPLNILLTSTWTESLWRVTKVPRAIQPFPAEVSRNLESRKRLAAVLERRLPSVVEFSLLSSAAFRTQAKVVLEPAGIRSSGDEVGDKTVPVGSALAAHGESEIERTALLIATHDNMLSFSSVQRAIRMILFNLPGKIPHAGSGSECLQSRSAGSICDPLIGIKHEPEYPKVGEPVTLEMSVEESGFPSGPRQIGDLVIRGELISGAGAVIPLALEPEQGSYRATWVPRAAGEWKWRLEVSGVSTPLEDYFIVTEKVNE